MSRDSDRKGLLIVLSGPSGSGKNTVLDLYRTRRKHSVTHVSVSATTRPPRPGERDGEAYHFLSRDRFEAMIAAGELAEWDIYCGHYYGTPKENIEKNTRLGYDTFLVITVEGARKIRECYPEAVLVFILPPSREALCERIIRRGAEGPDKIAGRMAKAGEEVKAAGEFDYLVVNDVASRAAGQLAAIIRAEKTRVRRKADFLKDYMEVQGKR